MGQTTCDGNALECLLLSQLIAIDQHANVCLQLEQTCHYFLEQNHWEGGFSAGKQSEGKEISPSPHATVLVRIGAPAGERQGGKRARLMCRPPGASSQFWTVRFTGSYSQVIMQRMVAFGWEGEGEKRQAGVAL